MRKYIVEWTPEYCEWLVLSNAGPFESIDEAIEASREPRDGVPNVQTVYDGGDASDIMRQLSGELGDG